MRKFWSYITNDKYSVGCTGGTVYVYDANGAELTRFKDIRYAYHPIFSPDGSTLLVKSTADYFVVYSLETLSLKHKVRFSNVGGSQDDGYTFSVDGAYFYNIERQKFSYNHAISIYDTSDFSRINMFFEDDNITEPNFIEHNSEGNLFVLGFCRGDNRVKCHNFISRFSAECGLTDMYEISQEDYSFYRNFTSLERSGFTDKAKQWSGFIYDGVDMTGMENQRHPLSELWEKYAAQK